MRTKCYEDKELYDPLPEQIAIHANGPDNRCLAHGQDFYWEGVRHVQYENGNNYEFFIVSRYLTQLRRVRDRLSKLFSAYQLAYDSREVVPKDRDATSISNKYTDHIGNEFCSILDEIVSMRDAALNIIYRMNYKTTKDFKMRDFKNYILSAPKDDLRDAIANSMFDPNSGDMLLDHMALHRNVATHATGKVNPVSGNFAIVRSFDGCFGKLKQLIFPLYDDIEAMRELNSNTAKQFYFRRDNEELKRFLDKEFHLDALDFAFDCYKRILSITCLAGTAGGFESRLPIIKATATWQTERGS